MEHVYSQSLTAGRHIRAFRLMKKPQEGQESCISYPLPLALSDAL